VPMPPQPERLIAMPIVEVIIKVAGCLMLHLRIGTELGHRTALETKRALRARMAT
jgi:hypothetical protein